ncbi:TPR end-of-group domain-containing protein [Flavobacterium sp. 25HG05S-40]|uniref:TPR end-of-group domain-containing protein n=1 Tax=Flavobacterium sp. 25HG05S-40 TaxID=3458682 RepID=UPI0040446339
MKVCQLLLLFFLGISTSYAQTQRELYDMSIKAYESKDFKSFLKLTTTLDSLRPFHPTYTYNLASANALNQNWEEALVALRTLVLMNNATDFENDADFATLKQDEGFRSLLTLKSAQSKVVATSKPLVTLSEKDLHPEGLVYLPISKIWLASSVRKRKIVAFDNKTGQCTDWLKDNNMLSIMTLKTDVKEQFLWVATAAFPEMEGYDKALNGKSEILKIDTKTKRIVKRFTVAGTHVFGDLLVAKNGTVYISDSAKPIIYRIEKDVITEFVSFEKDGYNLQGLAFNDTQSKLFVADYLKGITVIDLLTKSKTTLAFPEETSPKGIDGLVFYNNTLIMIQNGVKPIRILQFQLNEWQTEIVGFKVLDNNRLEFNEPALATVVGEQLYFFANSPWNAYDEKGNLDLNKVSNPMLFTCKLH